MDNYKTPTWLFEALDTEFHFSRDNRGRVYDPCALNPEDLRTLDGLAQTPGWVKSYFINFPYSDPPPWLMKIRRDQDKGITVVALAKLDPSTRWWKDYVHGHAEVRLVVGRRLSFREDGELANFPSVVLVFRPGVAPATGITYSPPP